MRTLHLIIISPCQYGLADSLAECLGGGHGVAFLHEGQSIIAGGKHNAGLSTLYSGLGSSPFPLHLSQMFTVLSQLGSFSYSHDTSVSTYEPSLKCTRFIPLPPRYPVRVLVVILFDLCDTWAYRYVIMCNSAVCAWVALMCNIFSFRATMSWAS